MKQMMFILIYLTCFQLYGQQRVANWFFGFEAGLDFSSGEPVAITSGKLTSIEGSSSISDTLGNLLFYTNGREIWNREHQIMLNGDELGGRQSAAQSCLIVPLPNSNNLYYVFTKPINGSGFKYSIIDMNLDSSLGAVNDSKNITLLDRSGEALTGTQHCNGIDYWIVTREFKNPVYRFHSFLLTENGVVTNSVVAPFEIGGAYNGGVGMLTFSQDGTKLVHTAFRRPIYIFNFCLSTGELELIESIPRAEREAFYSNQLSPNGELLYTTSWISDSFSLLSQFNLMADDIANSRINIDSVDFSNGGLGGYGFIGHLKLASNQKIYVSKWNQENPYTIHPNSRFSLDSLSVITQPNNLGLNCAYEENVIYLNAKPAQLGLPNFISNFTKMNKGIRTQTKKSTQNISLCEGETYTLPDGTEIDIAGVYESIIPSVQGCDSVIVTNISISEQELKQNEVSLCEGESYTLENDSIVFSQGIYSVRIFDEDSGCENIYETIVNVYSPKEITQDTTICEGQKYILPDGIEVELEGVYESRILATQGCDSIIITTNVKTNEQIFDEKEVSICKGESYTLPDGSKVETKGVYESTISVSQGCDTIITTTVNINSININMPIELVLELDSIELVNEIESSNTVEYLWSPAEDLSCLTCQQPYANPEETTNYLLEVKDVTSGCTASATVSVITIVNKPIIPNAFSPNDDGINDFFIAKNIPPDATFLLAIYNRWGQKVFETKNDRIAWDGTFNNQKQPLGVYVWFLKLEKKDGTLQQFKGNVTLVR